MPQPSLIWRTTVIFFVFTIWQGENIHSRYQGPRPPWLVAGRRVSRLLVKGNSGSAKKIGAYKVTCKAFPRQFKPKVNSMPLNRVKQTMKTLILTQHKDSSPHSFPGRHFHARNDSKIIQRCCCISQYFILCIRNASLLEWTQIKPSPRSTWL